jgi:tol-pal system protein YbgF
MGRQPQVRVRGDARGTVKPGPRLLLVPALTLALCGCALRSDVVRLERQLAETQRQAARRDSVAAANLAAIARLVQGVLDSLALQGDALRQMRGDVRVELYNVQQQLVAIQELTGQSQQRLTELRSQIEQRSQELSRVPATSVAAPQPSAAGPGAAGAPAGGTPPPGASGSGDAPAEQLLELGLQQLRRGSPATARVAFAEFLRRFPTHERAADAEFFIGESWTAEQRPDSAAAAYARVVEAHAASARAAASLYKLGLIAVAAGRRGEARRHFERVIQAYPTSEEAALAREQLRAIPPIR